MEVEKLFTSGEIVEILNGPFMKLTGEVREVNDDNQMLAVKVKGEQVEGILPGEILIELGFKEVLKRPNASSW